MGGTDGRDYVLKNKMTQDLWHITSYILWQVQLPLKVDPSLSHIKSFVEKCMSKQLTRFLLVRDFIMYYSYHPSIYSQVFLQKWEKTLLKNKMIRKYVLRKLSVWLLMFEIFSLVYFVFEGKWCWLPVCHWQTTTLMFFVFESDSIFQTY